MVLWQSLALASLLATAATGLMFHLEPNSRKCLKEEIHKVGWQGICVL